MWLVTESNEIADKELTASSGDEQSLTARPPIVPTSIWDDISYTDQTPLGSHVGPMESKRIYIPAKTAYCFKMTDAYRLQFSSYSIFVKFNPNITPPSGAYLEFDRKRNYLMSDDDGNIPTKTIYPGMVGDTNSFGTQMEGFNQPNHQWVRFRNPTNNAIHVIITMRFNP